MKSRALRIVSALWISGLLLSIPLGIAFARPLSDNGDEAIAGMSCLGCLGIMLLINIGLLVWLVRDANARGAGAGAWLLVVLIFGPLGFLAYLVARPKGRLEPCPNCGVNRPITAMICPHCGYRGGEIPR